MSEKDLTSPLKQRGLRAMKEAIEELGLTVPDVIYDEATSEFVFYVDYHPKNKPKAGITGMGRARSQEAALRSAFQDWLGQTERHYTDDEALTPIVDENTQPPDPDTAKPRLNTRKRK